MVLSGKKLIEDKIVTFPQDGMEFDLGAQLQPNGIDLRIIELFEVTGQAHLGRDKPMDFSNVRVDPVFFDNGLVKLRPGRHYLVNFREHLTLDGSHCALIIPRSSMLRAGVDVRSALWDTGWNGRLGGVIKVTNSLTVEYGARLAQIVVYEAETSDVKYSGRYQGADSQTAFSR